MGEAAHTLPVWMRFDEAMEYSLLSRELLRDLLRDGTIRGSKPGKYWPEEREGEECPECHGDGQLVCQCSCHDGPDDSYDEDAAWERRDRRESW